MLFGAQNQIDRSQTRLEEHLKCGILYLASFTVVKNDKVTFLILSVWQEKTKNEFN